VKKKKGKRLDYQRLAEALGDRGMVEQEALKLALQDSRGTGVPFPELLLNRALISDWELSRQVCRLYGLPFVPLDVYPPDPDAVELLDPDIVRRHRCVPVQQHGDVLTLCMPGLVPEEVLLEVEEITKLSVVPMVGSVKSNCDWIGTNLSVEHPLLEEEPVLEAAPDLTDVAPALPATDAVLEDEGWGSFFDEANEQVMMDLDDTGPLEVVAGGSDDLGDDIPQVSVVGGDSVDSDGLELPDLSGLSGSLAGESSVEFSDDSERSE